MLSCALARPGPGVSCPTRSPCRRGPGHWGWGGETPAGRIGSPGGALAVLIRPDGASPVRVPICGAPGAWRGGSCLAPSQMSASNPTTPQNNMTAGFLLRAGVVAPQCGHALAATLTSLPQSLHFTIFAMLILSASDRSRSRAGADTAPLLLSHEPSQRFVHLEP